MEPFTRWPLTRPVLARLSLAGLSLALPRSLTLALSPALSPAPSFAPSLSLRSPYRSPARLPLAGSFAPWSLAPSHVAPIYFSGQIGFIIGPVVLSLFMVLLELYSVHISDYYNQRNQA